uniref:Fibrinogen C-terminal domain-containing protein n=1 Tax=Amphimedon queenslandica TaxID=400682 RepID=A0A1X7TJV5_AMPQE
MTVSLYCSSLLILCIATSAITQNTGTLNAINCCSRIEKSVASFSSQINSTCNRPSDAATASLQQKVSSEVAEMSTRILNVSSKVSLLQTEVSSKVSSLKSDVSSKVEAVSLQVSSLQEEVSSKVESVSSEVAGVSSKLASVSSDVSSLQEAVSTDVSSLQQKVSSEVAEMSKRILNVSSKLFLLQTEVSSKVSSLKSDVSSKVEAVSLQVSSLQEEVSSEVSSLKANVSSEVESVSSEVAGVSSKLASVSSDVSSLQEAVSSLQQAVSSLSADIKKVLDVSSALATHVSSLEKSAVSSLSADIKKVLDYSSDPFFTSCYDILQKFPDSPSGYYRIVGFSHKVYCHMSSLPYNGNKGWIRIAHLDLYNTKDCPTGFRLIETQGIRACGRPYTKKIWSCTSTFFQVEGFKYSQIHGKLVGYQVGSPDGIRSGPTININSEYVDGFSLTYGRTRKHIWTFIAGQENNGYRNYCPCAKWNANRRGVPSFVGNDYYCEGGSDDIPVKKKHIYKNDPLWDGWGCGTSEKACCKPTWFSKIINPPTSESIELRLCLDEGSNNEDVYLRGYEIYIR